MIGTNISITTKNYAVAGGAVVYDTDAEAYFTANTAITNTADKNAINTFYLGLKSDGIYTKIKAMYLPIWGSAAACKWNLKDPRDLDAAYRASFSTGFTYSNSGITGNGSAYFLGWIKPTNLINNNTHLSFYSRTNKNENSFDMGVNVGSDDRILQGLYQSSFWSHQYSQVSTNIAVSSIDTRGMFIGTRISSTSHKAYKNGSLIATNTNTNSKNVQTVNAYIYMCAISLDPSNTPSFYSTKQFSFFSIGDGLTDTEASNFYTRVNTLMTYFGINV